MADRKDLIVCGLPSFLIKVVDKSNYRVFLFFGGTGNNIDFTRDVFGTKANINNQLSKQIRKLWIPGSLPVDHRHNCCFR